MGDRWSPDGRRRGSDSPVHRSLTLVPPISTTSTRGGLALPRAADERRLATTVLARLAAALRSAPRVAGLRVDLPGFVAIVTSRRDGARRMPA